MNLIPSEIDDDQDLNNQTRSQLVIFQYANLLKKS